MALVARKTWMRGCGAPLMACQARSMSAELQRASAHTVTPRIELAMASTARSRRAMQSENRLRDIHTEIRPEPEPLRVSQPGSILAPGDCSPSRNVVVEKSEFDARQVWLSLSLFLRLSRKRKNPVALVSDGVMKFLSCAFYPQTLPVRSPAWCECESK